MAKAYEIRDTINLYIETLAINRVDRFYPSALAKHLSISSAEAFNHLSERSGPEDELHLIWELRCPNCSRTLDLTKDKQSLKEYDCNCGEEFELNASDFFPVFKIDSEYKEYVLAHVKKKLCEKESSVTKLDNQSSLEINSGSPESLVDIFPIEVSISENAAAKIKAQSAPCIIQQFFQITQNNMGDGTMDQRIIKGSFNDSNFSGNSAIQADNVVQSQNVIQNETEEAFKELFNEINKIQDQAKKEQAEYNAEELREAIEKEDTSKAKRLLGFLKSSLGTVASLATIAKFLNISL
ncbi:MULTISPECIES: hypothetical protein [Exiguobacterium]|uniref:hypothetical protein n=1 Tax=Exiguobacterium TaxID=33986 RepID=UPI00045286D8|nr:MULTISPECIES: hypothetical protein [Exiguobacterium]EZP58286.1 hypothetical protein BW42_03198 [Exiguobacterium sp. RIT341]